jgi:YHS domain-containing protein
MKRVDSTRRALLVAASLVWMIGHATAGSIVYGAGNGPVIKGYDTVAYHTTGAPLKGDARFSADWNGAQWWFASDENRQRFLADPERYAPQYGGYCAYAMSIDSFAPGDPNRWKVVDGKLYLNANYLAQKLWERDIPGKIREANSYWPGKKRELEVKP